MQYLQKCRGIRFTTERLAKAKPRIESWIFTFDDEEEEEVERSPGGVLTRKTADYLPSRKLLPPSKFVCLCLIAKSLRSTMMLSQEAENSRDLGNADNKTEHRKQASTLLRERATCVSHLTAITMEEVLRRERSGAAGLLEHARRKLDV